jgi:hypothetical protein
MLKRSSFKRAVYAAPPRVPTAKIVGQRGVIRQVSDAVTSVPKEIILRSRPYRMWVATWPCDLCGWLETQAAHENLGKAMQGKVCDSRTFPLCVAHGSHAGHHFDFDNYVDISREEARELGARLSAQMRERALAAGWRFTNTEILKP